MIHEFVVEYKNGQPWHLLFRCPVCKFLAMSPQHTENCPVIKKENDGILREM